MKSERNKDDVQYFVTCTYCGTQTQLALGQIESDRPLKCPACGASLKVVPPPPPPKTPAKPPPPPVIKKKKPFDDYDAMLDERRAYEMRTAGELQKAQYVIGIILGGVFVTVILFIVLLQSC
ncbi:MAG: hypothetical protein PVH29_09590 [Candidatus Zixiibacteriota bacterium]